MPGASVLPVALCKGKLYFLFGRENAMEDSARGFADFGGGIDKGESVYDAAMREGSEEMSGFLGNPTQLRRLIKKHGGVYKIVNADPEDDNRVYTIHIFHFPYDKFLPEYYNKNHEFLWNRMDKKMLNDSKLFEKIEIDWFCETELKSRIREFRPFYRKFVERMRMELPQIRKFVRKCTDKYSPVHRWTTTAKRSFSSSKRRPSNKTRRKKRGG